MEKTYFQDKKEKAIKIYDSDRTIRSLFFDDDIVLNSDGFHHLAIQHDEKGTFRHSEGPLLPDYRIRRSIMLASSGTAERSARNPLAQTSIPQNVR
jgi:hypothetical protein